MAFQNTPTAELVVPDTAGTTDPSIRLVSGDAVPAELVAEYGANIQAAVIYRLNADMYGFTAVIENTIPYRVEGIVNTTQTVGNQVAEIYRFRYPNGGGSRPSLWFSSLLLNEIVFDAGTQVSFHDVLQANFGLHVDGGNLNVDTVSNLNGGATVEGRAAASLNTGGKMHYGTSSPTTNASGIATITHGASFTPVGAIVCQNGAVGSGGVMLLAVNGSYTSTTFQIKANTSGGPFVGTVGVSYILLG